MSTPFPDYPEWPAPTPLPELAPEQVLPAAPPEPPGPHLGWAVLWFLGFFAANIVITIGLVVVLALMLLANEGRDAFKEGNPGAKLFEQPGGVELLIIGTTFGNLLYAAGVVFIKYRGRVREKLALRGFHPVQLLFVVLLVGPLWLVAVQLALLSSRVLPSVNELGNQEIMKALVETSWLAIVIGGCLLPGIGEEILFRGFLGRGLVARYGLVLGVLFTSCLFGLAHLNPPQVVGTCILGMAFHLIYLSTKSLLLPMIGHALNNLFALGLGRLMKTFQGDVQDAAEPAEDFLLPWALVGAAALAVLGLGYLVVAMRTRWILPDGSPWSPGYLTAEMPPRELEARPHLMQPSTLAVGLAVLCYAVFAGVVAWEVGWKGG